MLACIGAIAMALAFGLLWVRPRIVRKIECATPQFARRCPPGADFSRLR